jgi:nitroreductase
MHRAFTAEPVDAALLERLVYAAGRAPLARSDIRHLIVVTDERLVRTVHQACPGFIADAPALIAICTDLDRTEEQLGRRGVDLVARLDAGAAAGYLTLAAPALGLGACIVTSWPDVAVQAIFGLPERIRPEVLVAVGHPVANPPKAMRRFPPIVHENRYGRPWEVSS